MYTPPTAGFICLFFKFIFSHNNLIIFSDKNRQFVINDIGKLLHVENF